MSIIRLSLERTLRVYKHFPTAPELTIYPPVLTVLISNYPDTTASLTCTSNVPVVFPADYTSMGIRTTYLDDTNSSVKLDFKLDKDLRGMLEGMEFICEARDPDDLNSTVSTASSTFRGVSGKSEVISWSGQSLSQICSYAAVSLWDWTG